MQWLMSVVTEMGSGDRSCRIALTRHINSHLSLHPREMREVNDDMLLASQMAEGGTESDRC